jgi:hypothetical protein
MARIYSPDRGGANALETGDVRVPAAPTVGRFRLEQYALTSSERCCIPSLDILLVEQIAELLQPALGLGLRAQATVEVRGIATPKCDVPFLVGLGQPPVPGRPLVIAGTDRRPVDPVVVGLSPDVLYFAR